MLIRGPTMGRSPYGKGFLNAYLSQQRAGSLKILDFLSSLKNQKKIEILDMFITFLDKHISF